MKKTGWRSAVIVLCLLLTGLPVLAAEQEERLLMETQGTVQIYTEKDTDSEVIQELPARTPVICIEAYADGWSMITYQDAEGYVLSDDLHLYAEQEQIGEEFESVEADNDLKFETMESLQKQQKSERLWGGIMILLIVIMAAGMFASGIRALKSSRRDRGETAKDERKI